MPLQASLTKIFKFKDYTEERDILDLNQILSFLADSSCALLWASEVCGNRR